VQDGKHLRILIDILEDEKAPLGLKVAVCTILRAAAQAEAVTMSGLTQVRFGCFIQVEGSLGKLQSCNPMHVHCLQTRSLRHLAQSNDTPLMLLAHCA